LNLNAHQVLDTSEGFSVIHGKEDNSVEIQRHEAQNKLKRNKSGADQLNSPSLIGVSAARNPPLYE
jgi:hypothetical protein